MKRTPKAQTLVEALAFAHGDLGLVFVDSREQEVSLSWPEVRARAQQVAASLRRLGVVPGDRVALIVPTSPQFMDAFFGALWVGAVPVPLYPRVRLGRTEDYYRATEKMLGACGARMVVVGGSSTSALEQGLSAARPALGFHTVDSLRMATDLSQEVNAERVSPDSLALIQFSSGSTVDPKPVALTHRQVIAQCAALHTLMPPESAGDLGVSWLPLYHDMGLIGGLLSAVYYPGPLVLIPPELFLARPILWLRAISRHRATVSPAPNFAYAMCVKRIADADLAGLDLSSWKYALNGAEPVSSTVLESFAKKFRPCGFDPASLMPVYGMSETALAITFTPRRWPSRILRVNAEHLAVSGEVMLGDREIPSVGVPIPGFVVQVRGAEGRVLPERQVGAIFAKGPSVMSGYFEQPEATAKALQEGWLDTGDLGFVYDGELHVSGRAKDVVIIRGANHSPQEFEDALLGLEGVREGCVVARGFLPEGGDGEALLLLAEVSPGSPVGLEETIRAAVSKFTGIRPHTVVLLAPGSLPRTSSGKLRRAEALRQYLAGALASRAVNA